MSQTMQILSNWIVWYRCIYEFIFSTWLIHTLFTFSCFNAQSHKYRHALVHTVLIVSEVLAMIGRGNKIKSWLEFFELLPWRNDIGPSPDELAKWQHFLGEVWGARGGGDSQLEDRNAVSCYVIKMGSNHLLKKQWSIRWEINQIRKL